MLALDGTKGKKAGNLRASCVPVHRAAASLSLHPNSGSGEHETPEFDGVTRSYQPK
jgi:hypothetical protein